MTWIMGLELLFWKTLGAIQRVSLDFYGKV